MYIMGNNADLLQGFYIRSGETTRRYISLCFYFNVSELYRTHFYKRRYRVTSSVEETAQHDEKQSSIQVSLLVTNDTVSSTVVVVMGVYCVCGMKISHNIVYRVFHHCTDLDVWAVVECTFRNY